MLVWLFFVLLSFPFCQEFISILLTCMFDIWVWMSLWYVWFCILSFTYRNKISIYFLIYINLSKILYMRSIDLKFNANTWLPVLCIFNVYFKKRLNMYFLNNNCWLTNCTNNIFKQIVKAEAGCRCIFKIPLQIIACKEVKLCPCLVFWKEPFCNFLVVFFPI